MFDAAVQGAGAGNGAAIEASQPDEEKAATAAEAPPLERSAAAALRRGRLITLAGVLLLCFDTPTFRLLQLSTPPGSVEFGLADAVWRGGMYALASLIVLRRESRTLAGALDALRRLGLKNTLISAFCLTGSGVAFPVAIALTSATNVLVIIAMMPLTVALMGRALGTRLPLHTWVAAFAGSASVGLVFATGVSAGASQLKGCLLALAAMTCFATFVTLGSHMGSVSLVVTMPLGGVLMICVAFAALGPRWHFATPASRADACLLLGNGFINGLSNVMMIVGSQTCPAAEVSLIGLLETALSPVLVYLVTLHAAAGPEVPDVKSIVAGVLIIATLAAHTVYDALWERRRARIAGDAARAAAADGEAADAAAAKADS